MQEPKTIYLNDYQSAPYKISESYLEFDIYDEKTVVHNTMQLESLRHEPLELDGEMLELDAVYCNGEQLEPEAYEVTTPKLTIATLPVTCELKVVTTIYPDENTALEGLYRSGEILCTQNEPEGFRRITYFLDRPDNMCRFTTKIVADKERYPLLLANGNRHSCGDSGGGRHWVIWEDPFPKPTYLFALVAGELGCVNDTFTTCSGREIELNIYCDPGNESKCDHAMRSLKASMTWDEEQYGREYDLDIYNIVAVDSFNMGAMENKGLNIFNSHYVLASEETATDVNFLGIESVIAHEYFHNWTGNRITCRDWFQLTLKEGLTVFRDQCFSADMNSPTVQRISDVRALRERQFVEDAGPTSHPIKPDHYIEINNFYTATVYEKGAEVIRMIHTMLGAERFRKGMDLYFETFDGQAVRTEDFLWAMSKGGGIDLHQFERWYHQERTPELYVEECFDETAQTFTLELTQRIPKNVAGHAQQPYVMPLGIALFDRDGKEVELRCQTADQEMLKKGMLIISKAQECFVFEGITQMPRVSINRNFTAPVKVLHDRADLEFLMMHESDGFNRYEAAQEFALATLKKIMETGTVDEGYLEAYGHLLADESIDAMFRSQLLELPGVATVMLDCEVIDVEKIYAAVSTLTHALVARHGDTMEALYEQMHFPANGTIDAESMGNRALKNVLLGLLMDGGRSEPLAQHCIAQYVDSVTMTDRVAALMYMENHLADAARDALKDFYERYKNDTLVMNKYFAICAASEREGCIDRVRALQEDPCFDMKVPNLVRSLVGTFCRNYLHFHDKSGSGYRFVADKIIELDAINPQIASGLAGAFKLYKRMHADNQAVMKTELERILAVEGLSKNVYEIVEKILD
ncbi:MAG: aminopeptidase N [Sulfurimonadaceae bacterium]|nr:aminopeptidase N [Sulfurimonadaceae bacterium]